MFEHYCELAAWNQRLSMVGSTTWGEAVERHFGESLLAVPWIPPGSVRVVDIGSGGGFPGLPILAARPGLEVTLVESRQRKWAFLRAAARRASLPARCLNVRVSATLPEEFPADFDVIIARAVRLGLDEWDALFAAASRKAFALVWAGAVDPDLPAGLEVVDTLPIQGSQERRIVKICNNRDGSRV